MANKILRSGLPEFWQVALAKKGAMTTCLGKATPLSVLIPSISLIIITQLIYSRQK
jgi:hypothetical protein